MKSSIQPADTGCGEPLLAGEGGLPRQYPPGSDPFADLDDLMVVIEALSPVWPDRAPMGPMTDMRL